MRAHQSLDLRRINVLAAGNDHVALAVGQMDVAIRIAPGHVADGAIVAAERFLGLFGVTPVAIKSMSIAGEQLARFAVRHLVARFVQNSDWSRSDAFAADRTELGELLVRMKHGHPPCLGSAIKLEQAGVRKHLHDLALGLWARGRRGDHQFGHGIEIVFAAYGLRQSEHHDVVGWHEGCECRAALCESPNAMFGVEALSVVDKVSAAAITESAKEIQ